MFQMTEFQKELAEAARQFAGDLISPTAEEDDEVERFRPDFLRALGEQGFCGITTPEAYGGLGLSTLDYCVVLEEIARVSASYAVSVAVTGLPQIILNAFGSESQKEKWLPSLASGEAIGAFALSEAGSGSDAASLRTLAVRDGDDYVLNGTKFWITHGGVADTYIVMARTGAPGAKGVSAFIVAGDTPGLSFGKKEKKMGIRASPTVEVILQDVRVPASQRLGDEGIGFVVAMTALDSGRITIGATSVGLCQASLDVAASYATQREQFGKAIIDFQGLGFLLADMACRTETARLLVHKAASLKDAGVSFSETAAMAKVVATDAAMAVSTDGVQALGGYGYTREYPVERYMRDAKAMQIVEGTNQIQRLVISRHLRRRYAAEQG